MEVVMRVLIPIVPAIPIVIVIVLLVHGAAPTVRIHPIPVPRLPPVYQNHGLHGSIFPSDLVANIGNLSDASFVDQYRNPNQDTHTPAQPMQIFAADSRRFPHSIPAFFIGVGVVCLVAATVGGRPVLGLTMLGVMAACSLAVIRIRSPGC